MELEELIARRRACRAFLPEPVPHDVVLRVVEAAARSSTASNVPYRELMIVDDREVIQAIRKIHPAMQSDPPVLLVIMTDTELALERVGRVGLESSRIDSGAAGENAWLAAIDEGLATGFTMISAMPGIQTVLGLPERMRVDLIMPLGYRAGSLRAGAPRRAAARVHRNQYGRRDDG